MLAKVMLFPKIDDDRGGEGGQKPQKSNDVISGPPLNENSKKRKGKLLLKNKRGDSS